MSRKNPEKNWHHFFLSTKKEREREENRNDAAAQLAKNFNKFQAKKLIFEICKKYKLIYLISLVFFCLGLF